MSAQALEAIFVFSHYSSPTYPQADDPFTTMAPKALNPVLSASRLNRCTEALMDFPS